MKHTIKLLKELKRRENNSTLGKGEAITDTDFNKAFDQIDVKCKQVVILRSAFVLMLAAWLVAIYTIYFG